MFTLALSAFLFVSYLAVLAPATIGIRQNERSRFIKKPVPTFFLHGWHGTYRSEKHKGNAINDAGLTHMVVRVDVGPDGEVHLMGELSWTAIHLLIEVSFIDKTNADYSLCGRGFQRILAVVRSRYYFDNYNVLEHSMVNMVLMNNMRDTAGEGARPNLANKVNVAGNFNGIVGNDDVANRIALGQMVCQGRKHRNARQCCPCG
ncbi:alpha/beta hydrolase [Bifidobacterium xylocopae]|uniref:Uncharacterized protein n=1 Tax=Bifidobacterium xylocopae TaxID=2493119 RepID=A0A366KEN8_9BIFI|nr:alpha/beta hydrolase [Bifidobacterium xylocopae]RBP99668.1 hypothetical protein CRD59_02780 [Bifidobacterium xylocopae]